MNKKNMLLAAFMTLSTIVLQAQTEASDSKFYVKINAGYGLITPGSYKLVSSSNPGAAAGNTSLSKQGLGSGIRFGGGIGVIISDFMNIGVDVDYLSGATLKSNSSIISSADNNYISQTQISYTSLSITPHVIFKALSKPGYLIYNKLGILLNLPTNLKKNQKDSTFINGLPAASYGATRTGEYKVGLTAGLNVALGVQFRLTDKLRGYAEIFGNYLVLSPTNYDEKITEVTNGVITNSDLHRTFIKNGQTSFIVKDNTTTSVESVYGNTFNMNTLGINIGIAYRF